MTHYFDGQKITDPVLQAIADRAEKTLIGCGIPLSRRVGVIVSDSIKDGDRERVVTLRRFADDPSAEGVGNNWRLIDVYYCHQSGPFADEDEAAFFIGMPVYALKALRAGGHTLEGFSIYHEGIRHAHDGQPFRANVLEWSRYQELRPTADYIDAWKPQTAKDREAFAAEIAEHQSWLAVV